MQTEKEIALLVFKQLEGTISGEELASLEEWAAGSENNRVLLAEMNDREILAKSLQDVHPDNWKQSDARIKSQIDAAVKDSDLIVPVHRVHFLRTAWFRYAAAVIILISGIGIYYKFSHTSQPGTKVVQNVPPASGDILPGSERAILTLSDGRQIALDSAASETIKDGTLSIEKNAGHLSYENVDVVAMNTMTTPKGGQYQLTLEDGTRVWLNAASSITYPTAFRGTTREVSIIGEAYFEVIKNKEKPFIVRTPEEPVTVLGTSFNVNAYAEESGVKTSLLEGSVKIGDTNIKPGQAYQNGKVKQTNIQQDIAWKNGVFNFQGLNVKQAMRQIARWYDVEVRFEGDFSDIEIRGKVGRNLSLADVLSGMEDKDIHFKLNNRILSVYR